MKGPKPPIEPPQEKQLGLYFDGATYDPAQDRERLGSQLERVRAFMSDGQWHFIAEIQAACGGSETSVSARIRDLRKKRFGNLDVQNERVTKGLWRYRLVLNLGEKR